MKNFVMTFVLALLVVLTCVAIRRMVVGNVTSTGQAPTVVAIGTSPVPPWPPDPPPHPPSN
jgi:heme/copper-type cytochrome/quinol oxidase subunit 4